MDQAVKSAVIIVVFVIIFSVLIMIIYRVMTGESLANKACRAVAQHFDPLLLVALGNALNIGLRPSELICDIMVWY